MLYNIGAIVARGFSGAAGMELVRNWDKQSNEKLFVHPFFVRYMFAPN